MINGVFGVLVMAVSGMEGAERLLCRSAEVWGESHVLHMTKAFSVLQVMDRQKNDLVALRR